MLRIRTALALCVALTAAGAGAFPGDTAAQAPPGSEPRPRDGASSPRFPDEAEVLELKISALCNAERLRRGLQALGEDGALREAARRHSADMRERGYFAHRAPEPAPRTPLDRYLAVAPLRPPYLCVGENLYFGPRPEAARAHRSLMQSALHRENILYAHYQRLGVGVALGRDGEFWVTQMFLGTRAP